ncbi:hypothetical protein RI367_007924 [Sorochytrium milnesiophthora]
MDNSTSDNSPGSPNFRSPRWTFGSTTSDINTANCPPGTWVTQLQTDNGHLLLSKDYWLSALQLRCSDDSFQLAASEVLASPNANLPMVSDGISDLQIHYTSSKIVALSYAGQDSNNYDAGGSDTWSQSTNKTVAKCKLTGVTVSKNLLAITSLEPHFDKCPLPKTTTTMAQTTATSTATASITPTDTPVSSSSQSDSSSSGGGPSLVVILLPTLAGVAIAAGLFATFWRRHRARKEAKREFDTLHDAGFTTYEPVHDPLVQQYAANQPMAQQQPTTQQHYPSY